MHVTAQWEHLLSLKEHKYLRTCPRPANTCLPGWSGRQIHNGHEGGEGRHQEPATRWFGSLSRSRPHHWFPVRQMTFWQGNSVNVWMVGWPRICKLCRRLSFLLWCSAWRPRLGMIQLGTSQDSNPNAYFNKVSVFVHGWLHIRRGQHLRAQHSIGHVCETRTAFHVAVCLNRITHCNMKARWEFQSLIDNTLSFYSFWFLIQHKLETVTIWHTYQLMTERKQSMDILMQKS